MEGVFVTSVVDNVIIGSDDLDRFVEAVPSYLARAARCSADLNKVKVAGHKVPLPSSADDILRLGAQLGSGPAAFLGEEYVGRRVRNQPCKVAKLKAAFTRLREACENPNETQRRASYNTLISCCTAAAPNQEIGKAA